LLRLLPQYRPPLSLLAPHDRLQHLPLVSLGHRWPPLGHGRQEEDLLLNIRCQAQQVHDLGDAGRGELGQLGELGLGLDGAGVEQVWKSGSRRVPPASPDQAGRVTADEIVVWCKSKTAVYKMPEVRIVDALAMTANGMVMKEKLAKLL